MRGPVFFSEKNVHGAWVVYGVDGIKQYYGYTKKEAERLYKEDCKTITERRRKTSILLYTSKAVEIRRLLRHNLP